MTPRLTGTEAQPRDVAVEIEIIIPVRIQENRLDLVDRVVDFACSPYLPSDVSILVVDDGSASRHFSLLQERLSGTRARLISTGRGPESSFSLALARNTGAQAASARYLLFLDADLMFYPGFFQDLSREVRLAGMPENGRRFLMCPVIYLTELGLLEWQRITPDCRRQFFISELLKGDSPLIEKYSSGTSAIVVSRDYYLARGGNDLRFSGWGYEDYEFTCRLIRRSDQFPLPTNWKLSTGNFMTVARFEGWKSVYRLYGDWLAQKGIWLFHAPHFIDHNYRSNEKENWELFQQRLQEDEVGQGEPPPLPDPRQGRSLFLTKNPFCYTREIAPYFGEVFFATSEEYGDKQSLQRLIDRIRPSRLVFGNPYRDAPTLNAYRWCRETGFPFIVCERGALPDSVYHDSTGFLLDSCSYHPSKWDHEIPPEEIDRVEMYIRSLWLDGKALELQPQLVGASATRQKLNIEVNKKVVLVPLQQPNDTVVQYFSGPIGSYANFLHAIRSLPATLGNEWVLVYKNHPADAPIPPIANAVCGDDCSIYDLVSICDAMVVLNSGTGLYGMMAGKPVYILGSSWYAHPKMNREVDDPARLADELKSPFVPDRQTVCRFIHYLRFKFYSFGEQQQRKGKRPDGSPVTSTIAIDYYEIRCLSPEPVLYKKGASPVSPRSLLFDRYRHTPISFQGEAKRNASQTDRRRRKLKKFLRDPRGFFRDAKNPLLRSLSYFFGKN